MSRAATRLSAGLATVLLGSCASGAMPAALPTWSVPAGVAEVLCATALHTPFTLEGDPTVSPLAWGVDISGRRFGILWPPGFTARFAPGLEILSPSGAVVERAGMVSDLGGAGSDTSFNVCGVGNRIYTH